MYGKCVLLDVRKEVVLEYNKVYAFFFLLYRSCEKGYQRVLRERVYGCGNRVVVKFGKVER